MLCELLFFAEKIFTPGRDPDGAGAPKVLVCEDRMHFKRWQPRRTVSLSSYGLCSYDLYRYGIHVQK